MDMQANVLEINGLVKRYGAKTAVNNIGLSVHHGEIVGFLGPNGAGKSTVMNIITGYLSPTDGTVIVNGKNIVEEPIEAKKCIGYLPEQPPLYFDMTVKEYLDFVCGLKGVTKKAAQHIKSIMETVHIDDVSGRLIKNLSKGYKQRVGLAEALIGNPDLIILDEPTVGLDPSQIIEFREIIRDIGKSRTVILSTHILQEVNAVCDRAIIINHGEIVADDTLDNLESRDRTGLRMIVKGTAEQCREAVDTCEFAEIMYSNEKNEYTELTVYIRKVENAKEKLFFAFADRRLAIVEMAASKSTLEDIFVEITNGTYIGNAAATPEEAELEETDSEEAQEQTVEISQEPDDRKEVE